MRSRYFRAIAFVAVSLLAQSALLAQSSAVISRVECFFDTDPGFGSATEIAVSALSTVSLSDVVDTTGLAAGYHALHVRAQDSVGNWGMPSVYTVYVNETPGTQSVANVEYHFDADPGFGSGNDLDIASGDPLSVDEPFDTTGLEPGYHTLTLRAQDNSGRWGLPGVYTVYVNDDVGTNAIDAYRYAFDSVPINGAGATVVVDPSATSTQPVFTIDTASLEPGYHTLYVLGASGTLDGLPETFSVYVNPDPGGTTVATLDSEFIDIALNSLNPEQFAISGNPANMAQELSTTGLLKGGAYLLKLSPTDSNGQQGLPTFYAIDIVGAYEGWRRDSFNMEEWTSGKTTFGATYTPGNYANGLRFAIGADISGDIAKRLPSTGTTEEGDFYITFRRRSGGTGEHNYTVDDITYTVKATEDLTDDLIFETGAGVFSEVSSVDQGDGTCEATYVYLPSLAGREGVFLYVDIEENE